MQEARSETTEVRWLLTYAPRATLALLILLGPLVAPVRSAEDAGDAAREMAIALGFTLTDLQRIREGEIVSRTQRGRSERELAISVAPRIGESHSDFYERIREGQLFSIDRTVSQAVELSINAVTLASFETLKLPSDEVERLRRVKAGSEFNLALSEIAALHSAAQRSDSRAVANAYREILAQRARAYLRGGPKEIAPYARAGRARARPAEDLWIAAQALAGLGRQCPPSTGHSHSSQKRLRAKCRIKCSGPSKTSEVGPPWSYLIG